MKTTKDVTVEFLKALFLSHGIDYATPLSVSLGRATILDREFGEYTISTNAIHSKWVFPKHTHRKRAELIQETKDQYLNKIYKGVLITDITHSELIGITGRAILFEYKHSCGHTHRSPKSGINKKKLSQCTDCEMTDHGSRKKVNGKLIKRSRTYIHWVAHKKKLPEHLHEDYAKFLMTVGEKPAGKVELVEHEGKYTWLSKVTVTDKDNELIAMSLRQSFRYSEPYKKALELAKIETSEGTRYLCAICGVPEKRTLVQVDHIEPVAPLDGRELKREEIIERVWTDKIQVLDKQCHTAKSTVENRIRRDNKKKMQ